MENILPDTAQSSDYISQIASQSFSTGLTEEVHDLESSPIQTASNISQRTRVTSNMEVKEVEEASE
ncbi:hypothetical protein V1527DRAFT_461048 [Lipomyces starkeyi]